MSPELIGISIAAVAVLAILFWLLLPRSKSAAPANILLETRIPGAKAPQPIAIESAMKGNAKDTGRKPALRKKSAAGRQKHHGSPRKASPAPEAAPDKPAPVAAKKSPPKPAIDPKLSGRISELDNRLDAIEELVASIEESLAEFDGLDESKANSKGSPAKAA